MGMPWQSDDVRAQKGREPAQALGEDSVVLQSRHPDVRQQSPYTAL